MNVIYNRNDSGQYYKTTITIVIDDPNCGITYDHHYDDHNSLIIQASRDGNIYILIKMFK
jgi:hypothetical protein